MRLKRNCRTTIKLRRRYLRNSNRRLGWQTEYWVVITGLRAEVLLVEWGHLWSWKSSAIRNRAGAFLWKMQTRSAIKSIPGMCRSKSLIVLSGGWLMPDRYPARFLDSSLRWRAKVKQKWLLYLKLYSFVVILTCEEWWATGEFPDNNSLMANCLANPPPKIVLHVGKIFVKRRTTALCGMEIRWHYIAQQEWNK